ncbi:leucine-rich repeat protein, partial [Salmonella enterica]|uniref:leucine-rich repeat protein n=1 Tax=Salmonella enterica TaxID=28901 RepID=UPI0020C2F690
ERLEISGNVRYIHDYAFFNCINWNDYRITYEDDPILCPASSESLYLPDTVQTIGNYAFYNCYNLEYLVIPKSTITIG